MSVPPRKKIPAVPKKKAAKASAKKKSVASPKKKGTRPKKRSAAPKKKSATSKKTNAAPAKRKAAPKKKTAARPKQVRRKTPPAPSPPPPRRPLLRRALRIAVIAGVALFLLSAAWVVAYRFVNPPITALMLVRYGQSEAEDAVIYKEWRDYEEISPYLVLAVVAAEDQRFYDHYGFDFTQIRKVLESRSSGKRMRGASTLSQQAAKNAFLWPARSWVRKGLEVYFTALLETLWSKRRILEIYLNVAETGDGIYGAEAAARTYFNKAAKDLSPEEGALIAAVLPNPRAMSPAAPSPYVLQRRDWILKQMHNLGGTSYLK